jgi:hypothetical protein
MKNTYIQDNSYFVAHLMPYVVHLRKYSTDLGYYDAGTAAKLTLMTLAYCPTCTCDYRLVCLNSASSVEIVLCTALLYVQVVHLLYNP